MELAGFLSCLDKRSKGTDLFPSSSFLLFSFLFFCFLSFFSSRRYLVVSSGLRFCRLVFTLLLPVLLRDLLCVSMS